MIDPQAALSYLKINWWLWAPTVGNILSAMTCNSTDFTVFGKFKKPRYDIPLWAWGICCWANYFMSGYAMNMIWTDAKAWDKPGFQPTVAFFSVTLITNLLWTPLAMHFRKLYPATIVSAVSVVSGALATFYASNLNATAGNLLVPWVVFYAYATLVSYAMARDNKPRKAPKKD